MVEKKQRLVWIGSVVPEDFYKKLCSMGYKNQQASRIAQLNIIKGLEAHYGVPFDYISGPALPAYPKFQEIKISPYTWETENGGKGIFVSYLNLEYINRLFKSSAMEKAVKQLTGFYRADDLITVYVNSPHTPFIRAGIEVKKLFPHAKLVLIIPDLPQFMEMQISPVKKILKKFDIFYIEELMKQFDFFVPYSKHMIPYLHLDEEKCVTMEGCVSDDVESYTKSEGNLPFTFMYSGTADIRFGLKLLIDAFEKIEDKGCKLIITGKGDATEYIKKAEKRDKRIYNFGFVDDYSRVKQMQADADVMLNMRLPSEEASMYCFPSKLFEYMKTGNPVLSFKIGGIPDDYLKHLILIEDESVTAMKAAMLDVMKMSKKERQDFAAQAKQFVMTQKNTEIQTKKIYDLVEGKKKKILIAYDTMMTGGTTTALLSLLNEIDYNKMSVDLVLFVNGGPFFQDIPQEVNLLEQAYKTPKKRMTVSRQKIIRTVCNGNTFRAIFSYFKYKNSPKGNLRNILMHYGFQAQVDMSRKIEEEYDAAIGFIEGWADQYILSKKVKAKSKLVWIHPDYKASYLVPEIDRKLFKHATNIVVISKSCETNICEIFPEYADRVKIIENISSVAYIKKRASEDTPVIKKSSVNFCTVARCDMDVKGLDRILTALKNLREIGQNDFLWHYIGAGRDFQQLKEKIDTFELQDNVICYGQMNNPLVILKQMDVFVLASRYEGKPISVAEALALQKPCIVTEYASAREQIEDGKNGIIVKNSSEGVYEGLKKYIESESIKKSLEEGARNTKCNENTDEIIKLYQLI